MLIVHCVVSINSIFTAYDTTHEIELVHQSMNESRLEQKILKKEMEMV